MYKTVCGYLRGIDKEGITRKCPLLPIVERLVHPRETQVRDHHVAVVGEVHVRGAQCAVHALVLRQVLHSCADLLRETLPLAVLSETWGLPIVVLP